MSELHSKISFKRYKNYTNHSDIKDILPVTLSKLFYRQPFKIIITFKVTIKVTTKAFTMSMRVIGIALIIVIR